MEPGTPVQIRSTFEGGWAGGFVVVQVLEREEGTRVQVRRNSDGAVLPAEFPTEDVAFDIDHRG